MDRGSQLSKDDEDDEDDKDDKEDEEERRRRRTRQESGGGRRRQEEATDIKSNNPHLAGGEKLMVGQTQRQRIAENSLLQRPAFSEHTLSGCGIMWNHGQSQNPDRYHPLPSCKPTHMWKIHESPPFVDHVPKGLHHGFSTSFWSSLPQTYAHLWRRGIHHLPCCLSQQTQMDP